MANTMANTLGKNSRHNLPGKNRSSLAVLLPVLALLGFGFGMAPGAHAANFTVTKTTDTNDGRCAADCSLREAIRAANASFGVADVITVPAGTYTLTISGNAEDAAATGDLDIIDTVTINGAGSATTIIQAGTNNTNGIDKVFSVNQLGGTDASATFNGVTIRFGRNTSVCDFAVTFAHLGAGIDFFGGSSPTATSLTITNSVITGNTVANLCAPGGAAGVNADDGNLTIINSAIANNETTNQPGGGVSFVGNSRTMVMTNSIVSNNTAKGDITEEGSGVNGEGGGIFVRQNINGTVMIHGSQISNNTSESRAGGIQLRSDGTLNTTIDQGTVITGNTSLGTDDGISEGGGVNISILAGGTTTLKDVTITNNHANGESGNPSDPGTGGGIYNSLGTLNVSLSRITGNTAPTGSGLTRTGGTVTAENNWWGCNDVPGAAGCDTVSGTADVDPRLDLKVTATPATILGGGTSSVKADVLTNSNGAAVLPVVLNGPFVDFSATNGTMSPPSIALVNLMATSNYTNTSCPGPATVMAALDNGTDDASITINCPTTTTTLPPTTTTTTTLPPTTTTTTTLPPTTTTTTTLPPVTCDGLPATIVGNNNNNTIFGTPGNDVIHGRGGNDVIMDSVVTTASAAGRGPISCSATKVTIGCSVVLGTMS